jgi:peptide/nickel transport system permease protein
MLLALVLVTAVVFVIINLTPGDPVVFMLGPVASQDQVVQLRHLLGLDRPVWQRYVLWLWRTSHGDFGVSLRSEAPVLPMLLQRVPPTVELMVGAMTMAIVIAIPIGVLSATKRNTPIDALSRVVALLGISMPGFWLALIAILVFAYYIPVLPPSGIGGVRHLVLPAITLGAALTGIIMRLTRSSVLEVLGEDYVRTGRAKGLGEPAVLYRHALRNGMLPVMTIIGLQTGALLGGTVVIETVFAWPGLGFFTYQALVQRDYPVIMGSLVLYAASFLIVNLLTDLAYLAVDPRIAYAAG